jgi:crossover junction endodeoxyribonuclease RusA
VTDTFSIFIPGHAAPQGSKRHVGKGILLESSKRVRPWRDLIVTMCHAQLLNTDYHGSSAFVGPVDVWLTFRFDRPRHHFGTGRNANLLKPGAPIYPRTGGDLDKLMRAVADALGRKHGAGVIADDADIVTFNAAKRYATPLAPVGCDITITQAGRSQ